MVVKPTFICTCRALRFSPSIFIFRAHAGYSSLQYVWMFPGAPPQGFTLLPKPRRLQCTFQRPWSQLSGNRVARFRDRLEVFWYQRRVHIAGPFLASRFHNMKGVSPKLGPKYGPVFGTRNIFFLQTKPCSGQPRGPFLGPGVQLNDTSPPVSPDL
jgi:hypothetical protein